MTAQLIERDQLNLTSASTHEEMLVNSAPEEIDVDAQSNVEDEKTEPTVAAEVKEEPIVIDHNHSDVPPNPRPGDDGEIKIEGENDPTSTSPADASSTPAPTSFAPRASAAPPHFTPIDARSLSSAPLVRARILALLRSSRNGMHAYKNLMLAIGCVNPSRSDRRFFIVRIREGIRDGLWEKVCVPGRLLDVKEEEADVDGDGEEAETKGEEADTKKKSGRKKKEPDPGRRGPDIMCLRLLSETVKETEESRRQAEKEGVEDDEDVGLQQGQQNIPCSKACSLTVFACSSEDVMENLPVWNVSIHKQITNILHEAGHLGVTISVCPLSVAIVSSLSGSLPPTSHSELDLISLTPLTSHRTSLINLATSTVAPSSTSSTYSPPLSHLHTSLTQASPPFCRTTDASGATSTGRSLPSAPPSPRAGARPSGVVLLVTRIYCLIISRI